MLPANSNAAISIGPLKAVSLAVVQDEERRNAEVRQAAPLVTGIAAHIRRKWDHAREARREVEDRMLANMRARRGQYDPEKLVAIEGMGGSAVYAGMTSVKCRAAASWLRDVLMATGTERPWTLRPTPVPDLPPEDNEEIVAEVAQAILQSSMQGQPPNDAAIKEMMKEVREQALAKAKAEARERSDKMADKMEDQLVEGGFMQALDAVIDDITTFPCAILKGPVIRRRKVLKWVPDPATPGASLAQMTDELVSCWERVSPFNIYPSPQATDVNEGDLIEKHQLSRLDLLEMIGVEGYDEGAIRLALEAYGKGGLRDWLTVDTTAIADATGLGQTATSTNSEGLIDALQFWGPVQGQELLDWGMNEKDVPDPLKDYHIEAWLVGTYVVKAVLNYDPLCRKPYYKASYEDVPGNWWGNSIADLLVDTQTVINAAARAIVNNMGIASGPQVTVNVSRLATGEDIQQVTPWRIWQVKDDPMGGNSRPIDFFQPDSRIGELMAVFDKFNQLADEYSGLPKYMAGDNAGGAGRTASGLSMLMSNAGKSIKQVISNIDMGVLTPMLERLYDHNMQFAKDPDLKGDVKIVARGAASLVTKETAQLRRNEFLMATSNPIDMQIVGVEGRAAILRETAKNLDMDTDKVVPPLDTLRKKLLAAQMMQQPQQGSPPAPQGMGSGQTLADGAPTTDNFSPPAS